MKNANFFPQARRPVRKLQGKKRRDSSWTLTLTDLLAQTKVVGDCWIWQSGRSHYGYGAVRYHGKPWLAHRLSYRLHGNELPDGALLMHSCDQRLCINPIHLSIGTTSANIRDMWTKGRSAHLVITPEILEEILREYQPRHRAHGAAAIAKRRGITRQAVTKAVRRAHK